MNRGSTGDLESRRKKGNYNVIQIDPNYVPAPIEHKQVFGVTFEQGRNELKIDDDLLLKYCDREQRDSGSRKEMI